MPAAASSAGTAEALREEDCVRFLLRPTKGNHFKRHRLPGALSNVSRAGSASLSAAGSEVENGQTLGVLCTADVYGVSGHQEHLRNLSAVQRKLPEDAAKICE
jgi:hypothetical protein